jgi:hypothetical protein
MAAVILMSNCHREAMYGLFFCEVRNARTRRGDFCRDFPHGSPLAFSAEIGNVWRDAGMVVVLLANDTGGRTVILGTRGGYVRAYLSRRN